MFNVFLNDEFCTLQQLLVVPTYMQSSMCLPRLPNLHVVYSSKPRTPTLVTLQLPVPLFGCTSCSALCLQLATFCSVLCHSFFNQGGVISTCLGALFRPRWLRQPAGRGDVLNLSFPVWSRDVDTVVRHQWYITARCTRTLARLRHATLFNPHMHGAAINTHSYCVVRTARLGSNYALAAQSGSAALLNN